MVFNDPLLLLLILPMTLVLILASRFKRPSVRISSGTILADQSTTLRLILMRLRLPLRWIAIALFIIALARPQKISEETRVQTEGIDIVLAIDASGSMLAEDFTIRGQRYNRLEVVKTVVRDFIQRRKTDRIGMVAFAGRAYTVCPLTLDYDWLIENLERVEIGSIEDGTAVGSAVSSSLNRLADTEAKSKIVILLTDGVNNKGKIQPLTAAEAAKALGVKIYTIGAGTRGTAPFPRMVWGRKVYQDMPVDIDEDMLRKIASLTGGRYFRATDTKSLAKIYGEIDKLETTPIEEIGFREYEERFLPFALAGLVVLLIELFLFRTLLRRLP